MGISKELALVEEALERALASDVELFSKASKHIIRSGGKRLRPRVLLLSHKAAGGRDTFRAVPLAAAVELLHTASLIHDDINDHSDTRRGQATINARWGNSMALLTGDFVFVRLLSLVTAFDHKVIQVLADSCQAIVEGEALQMLSRGDAGMTEELYLKIVSKKTGSLFSACAEMGGMLAEGTERQVATLRNYGLNLGIAFQIRDDVLDLVGSSDELGKPVASDLEQGKMSIATLFAIRESEKARETLFSKKDARRAIRILRDTGALEYAMLKAREYSEEAKKALSALPQSESKAELRKLAAFAVARGQ